MSKEIPAEIAQNYEHFEKIKKLPEQDRFHILITLFHQTLNNHPSGSQAHRFHLTSKSGQECWADFHFYDNYVTSSQIMMRTTHTYQVLRTLPTLDASYLHCLYKSTGNNHLPLTACYETTENGQYLSKACLQLTPQKDIPTFVDQIYNNAHLPTIPLMLNWQENFNRFLQASVQHSNYQ